MKRIVDLHTHSTASDGQYTPTELIQMAQAKGIQVVAITDHDNVEGVAEAERAGDLLGIRIVRGVELGAMEHRNFHILGYNFSADAPNINALSSFKREQRNLRNLRMVEFLRSRKVDISLEEVNALAEGRNIGRPHFAQFLVKQGYVSTVCEAFDRYLDTPEYDNIRVAMVPAKVCVETIKKDGGVVSLAHPYQLGYDDETLRDTIKQLTDWGLDAIECFYPRHTPEQTEFYLKLAREFGLHTTGGSDFHGETVKPDIELARIELELAWMGIG